MDLNSVEVFEMMYDRFGVYFGDYPDEPVAKICARCGKVKYREEYQYSPNLPGGMDTYCKSCRGAWRRENSDVVRGAYHRRRARLKKLPNEFTPEEQREVLSNFSYKCAITGEGWSWDHAIPIATGHGGTVVGNMIPLRSDLNISKNDRNIFEWFSDNKDRLNLSQTKFDALIEYLAKTNDMTTKEYREYAYECHANPRTEVGGVAL